MIREEKFVEKVAYCDVCLANNVERRSYGNKCYVCNKDICEDHTAMTLPDYAGMYKLGTYNSLEICEECKCKGKTYIKKVYNLRDECEDKYIRLYQKWKIKK